MKTLYFLIEVSQRQSQFLYMEVSTTGGSKWHFLGISSPEKINGLLTITIVTVFLAVLFSWVWGRRKMYALSLRLSGPMALPFAGCAGFLISMVQSTDPMGTINQTLRKYPGIVRIWVGPELVLLVHKPEDVESILKCRSLTAKPPIVYKLWTDRGGNGILTTNGLDALWKNHRKLISAAFSSSTLISYQPAVQCHAEQLLQDLGQFCGKGIVDYEMIVSRYVADYSSESLFGYKATMREGKEDILIHAPEWVATGVYKRMTKFWNILDTIYWFTPDRNKELLGSKVVRKMCNHIHDEKMKSIDNIKDKKAPCVMDVLLKAESRGLMTRNEVIEELMNMWGAGVDTVNKNILQVLLMLAMHKECQEKVFKEIRDYYKDNRDAPVEKAHLQYFPYLEMCIKEVLRIFPATTLNLRYVTEAFTMKNGSEDVLIPPNTTVALLMMISHRNPDVWPNPEHFIPERFSPEEVDRRHPFAFYPFSGGPRVCIGQKYAMIGAKTSIVYILRKFEVHSDWKLKDMPTAYGISINSAWGYKARLTERKW